MNDKDLADRIVALGVGVIRPILAIRNQKEVAEHIYIPPMCDALSAGGPNMFVRDPRVAMAMMEKLLDKQDFRMAAQILDSTTRAVLIVGQSEGQGDSLPRAINEACVEVLT